MQQQYIQYILYLILLFKFENLLESNHLEGRRKSAVENQIDFSFSIFSCKEQIQNLTLLISRFFINNCFVRKNFVKEGETKIDLRLSALSQNFPNDCLGYTTARTCSTQYTAFLTSQKTIFQSGTDTSDLKLRSHHSAIIIFYFTQAWVFTQFSCISSAYKL